MHIPDYPLRFTPLYRSYLWGGRRLETLLNKRLPAESRIAESWEVVDHGKDQSVVLDGPLAGQPLRHLFQVDARELLGGEPTCDRFPLLFKFLDAQQSLSVQVHPNDQQAARLDPPDLGKTEAWIVVHAEPDSVIYAGLKRGIDRRTLEQHVADRTTEQCLHQLKPQPGDCVFIPAGTVHALGAGLVIAEIQQSSDTTFRLFDWNRTDADGRPRDLHIQQALDVIDFDQGPVAAQIAQPTGQPGVENLVHCDQFVMDRCRLQGNRTFGGDQECHLLVVLEGHIQLEGDPVAEPLRRGQVALLPAALDPVKAEPAGPATVLDIRPGKQPCG